MKSYTVIKTLSFILLLVCVPLFARKRTPKEERSEVGFRLIAKQSDDEEEMEKYTPTEAEIQAAKDRVLFSSHVEYEIVNVENKGGGVIKVVHHKPKKLKQKAILKSSFISTETGKVLLEGLHSNCRLLSSIPYPVFLGSSGSEFSIHAIATNGDLLWLKHYLGKIRGWTVDEMRGEIVVIKSNKTEVLLEVINSLNGNIEHSIALSKIQFSDNLYNRSIYLDGNSIYTVFNGRLSLFSTEDKSKKWQHEITINSQERKENRFKWYKSNSNLILGVDNWVHQISQDSGVLWSHSFDDDFFIDEILDTDYGVLVGLRSGREAIFTLFNKETGSEVWSIKYEKERNLQDKKPVPLSGMIVYGEKLIISAQQKLLALDLKTGKEIYSHELGKVSYLDYQFIRRHGESVVLIGSERIEARSLEDGKQLWKHIGLCTLHKLKQERKGVFSGLVAVGYQAAASISGASTYRYDIKSGRYRLESFETYQRDKFSNMSAKSLLSATQAGLRYLKNSYDKSSNYVVFNRPVHIHKPSRANVVLVNLTTGELRDILLLDGELTCNPEAIVDIAALRIFQYYRTMTGLCKMGTQYDILQLHDDELPNRK